MAYVPVSISPQLALRRSGYFLLLLALMLAALLPVLVTPSVAPVAGRLPIAVVPAAPAHQTLVSGQVPFGFTSSEWQAIQQAIASTEYQLAWHAADQQVAVPYYWAPNRRQEWNVVFAQSGAVEVTPAHGEPWRWGLTLTNHGYQGTMQAGLAGPAMSADKERLTYQWDANLSEWWINAPDGLEQGFTLLERPAVNAGGPLVIEMAIQGDLTPRQSGQAIEFVDAAGENVLRYGHLKVFDASGAPAPAWLNISDRQSLQILIDDTHALYPLTVDPVTETAKLTASDGAEYDDLGRSVAISDDTAVVGAPGDDFSGSRWNMGSAYVFVKAGPSWTTGTQTAKLNASDGAAYDTFGTSVDISGNTIVVGSPVAAPSGAGAVYVFEKPGGGWASGTQTAKLTASDASAGAALGRSVAIDGNAIIAATYTAAYVFVEPVAEWVSSTETAKLTASDGVAVDNFGSSVDINGNVVVVGSAYDDIGSNTDQGSVYVFVAGGSWSNATETAKLTASDGAAGDNLGNSVAISGDTIVAGASVAHIGAISDAGAAYVFEKPGGGWTTGTETAKLSASDATASDWFGSSVAIDGNVLVVGAQGDDPRGSAYAFVRSSGEQVNSFIETEKLMSSYSVSNQLFGYSVDVNSATIVVGAFGDRIGSNSYQGSAYIFADAVPLAVTLASFDATAQPDHILVTWETVSEINNSGFNLYRGMSDDWHSATLLAYVPSQSPGSAPGFAYSFADADVQPGQTVWYWLEDVDLSGAATLHGPVNATMLTPTVVTLTTLEAGSQPALPPVAAGILALAVAVGLFFRRSRKKRPAERLG